MNNHPSDRLLRRVRSAAVVGKEAVKHRVVDAFRRRGLDLTRLRTETGGIDSVLLNQVSPFTMTSRERLVAMCDAVSYVSRFQIPGAIVECGVWRGGSMMAAALTLIQCGDTSRELYLYDTFAGMTDPTHDDVDLRGRPAADTMISLGQNNKGESRWCNASLADVEANMSSTGYPRERMRFLAGPVEETIPAAVPDGIALLRLDTDWYESTAHELQHLVPLMAPGAVLIVDDYGHWQGAQKAVDEYLLALDLPLLLNRIDYTGRIAVMPGLPGFSEKAAGDLGPTGRLG